MMSGLPGSGKTTFAQKQAKLTNGICISRDDVRFSLLKEDDDYFAKENLVFATWIKQINDAIEGEEYDNIYIDATHLNDKSRRKVINRLTKKIDFALILIIFTTPIETCIERNTKRTGRRYVSQSIIESMNESFDIYTDYKRVIYLEG